MFNSVPAQAERQHAQLISPGLVRPLETLPHHHEAPFVRRQMAGGGLFDELGLHVAVHQIDDAPPDPLRTYCDAHVHTLPELNLLLSPGHLLYRVELGEEVYEVTAPASILVPAGLSHRGNVIEGSGFFVVVIGAARYDETFAPR